MGIIYIPNNDTMFNTHKKTNKMWIALIIVTILVAITLLLQTQILNILSDMQAFILKSTWVMDANPLPAMPVDTVMDSNPLPIMPAETVMDSNPLPIRTF